VLSPEQLSLLSTDFKFKNQKGKYKGKVRDVYDLGDELLIITTDRISAFDHILSRPIPYKGQVLNQIAAHFLNAVKDICKVWLKGCPDPNVSIGIKCKPIPIEMVVRGYLAGHAWREYSSGSNTVCGVAFDNDMKENQKFSRPIITPTTKASSGHDEDISIKDIKRKKIIDEDVIDKMCELALEIFQRGTEMAASQGLILVDTKYEFGLYENELVLMDEIHTPDSSRYFEIETYEENLEQNKPQIQLSKEFVREWLMAHGFQGKEDQIMPEMPDLFVWHTSDRYINLYERITGHPFEKPSPDIAISERIARNLVNYL
jgi:phosphoribosylaminoimidazole-succinocarboxamide synthase